MAESHLEEDDTMIEEQMPKDNIDPQAMLESDEYFKKYGSTKLMSIDDPDLGDAMWADAEFTQVSNNFPQIEAELIQAEKNRVKIAKEVNELLEFTNKHMKLIQTKSGAKWGFRSITRSISRVAKKAARATVKVAKVSVNTVRRVGGHLIKILTSVFNKYVGKAKAIASEFYNYLNKVKMWERAKRYIDAFFRKTESCPFELFFKATVGVCMKLYGFNFGNINAAYRLLTRPFYLG